MVIFNALLNLSELKELYSGKPVCVCPLYKGVINALKTFEAAGNPITIPEYKSLVKLTTSFSPKQAGTGNPSPENVRAISGYDGVTVTRCGKNLLDISLPYSFSPDGSNRFSRDLNLTGTFVFSAQIDYTDQGMSTSALFSYVVNGSTKYISAGNSNGETVISGHLSKLSLINWSSSTGTINKIQLELGSTPTSYEPYQGSTATLTLPETIYGGTVDVVTGAGSKTWGFIASYNGESLPGEWISDRDVYAPDTTPTTGAQVAYQLATPKSFKVSQVTIPSLKGENYFFTNGEYMDIIYKKESFWSDET